jgi:hypothetical protein
MSHEHGGMTRREFLSRAAVTTGSVVLASAAAPALGAQVAGRGAEPKLGAQLIGKLEGPELVMDPEKWPKKFGEAPSMCLAALANSSSSAAFGIVIAGGACGWAGFTVLSCLPMTLSFTGWGCEPCPRSVGADAGALPSCLYSLRFGSWSFWSIDSLAACSACP